MAKTTYYVATLAEYVLADAENDDEARRLGHEGLAELHAERGQRIGKELPVNIIVVRPATHDEIDLDRWNREMLEQEQGQDAD